MMLPASPPRSFHQGFSLLEMLVALVILAFSLGALYQAAGGASRIVRVDQEYAYAVMLAESLLAERSALKIDTPFAQGVQGLYRWQVEAEALPGEPADPIPLQRLDVRVEWGEGNPRRVILSSVVAGAQP